MSLSKLLESLGDTATNELIRSIHVIQSLKQDEKEQVLNLLSNTSPEDKAELTAMYYGHSLHGEDNRQASGWYNTSSYEVFQYLSNLSGVELYENEGFKVIIANPMSDIIIRSRATFGMHDSVSLDTYLTLVYKDVTVKINCVGNLQVEANLSPGALLTAFQTQVEQWISGASALYFRFYFPTINFDLSNEQMIKNIVDTMVLLRTFISKMNSFDLNNQMRRVVSELVKYLSSLYPNRTDINELTVQLFEGLHVNTDLVSKMGDSYLLTNIYATKKVPDEFMMGLQDGKMVRFDRGHKEYKKFKLAEQLLV